MKLSRLRMLVEATCCMQEGTQLRVCIAPCFESGSYRDWDSMPDWDRKRKQRCMLEGRDWGMPGRYTGTFSNCSEARDSLWLPADGCGGTFPRYSDKQGHGSVNGQGHGLSVLERGPGSKNNKKMTKTVELAVGYIGRKLVSGVTPLVKAGYCQRQGRETDTNMKSAWELLDWQSHCRLCTFTATHYNNYMLFAWNVNEAFLQAWSR